MRRIGAALLCLSAVAVSRAAIDLELRAVNVSSNVGDTVALGLFAVSDDSELDQIFAAADVMFAWDPNVLLLTGLDNSGGISLLFSDFPLPDPHHLNEALPPADGDAFYQALAFLGTPAAATPQGALLTTFQFTALRPAVQTSVDILVEAGDPLGRTAVFDGTVPNLDVTGHLRGATLEIVPEPATASMFLLIVPLSLSRRLRRTR